MKESTLRQMVIEKIEARAGTLVGIPWEQCLTVDLIRLMLALYGYQPNTEAIKGLYRIWMDNQFIEGE